MTEKWARYGWGSRFPEFTEEAPLKIREKLSNFVSDASKEQIRAWDESIPPLQAEVREILRTIDASRQYSTILEYELPMESRRTDALLLVEDTVVVIEFKGKDHPSQADIDQTAAYARDLRCYHRACWERPIEPVLVPVKASGYLGCESGVHIMGPNYIDVHISKLPKSKYSVLDPAKFLEAEAYCPMPTIVQAARELMESGKIRPIHRARAATEPALGKIREIIYKAAQEKGRYLVLLTGVPGAGKTLVGLQAVHAQYLDKLAVNRTNNNKSTVPAVFLSGNGPLVQVLQYELRTVGGGGRTFVRGVKDYVKRYSARADLIPPEHVLVFDEAQRAFDALQVQAKHKNTPGFQSGKSEPEHFIDFAERIPEWCVVIGLIGGGQEIHVGEEAGLGQWCQAIQGAMEPERWIVHFPEHVQKHFSGSNVRYKIHNELSLDQEIRFHMATDLHKLVGQILEGSAANQNSKLAQRLEQQGYHLRITRDLETAKNYLRERYAENFDARYGLIASSKDKDLVRFDVKNDFQSTKRTRFGPWFSDGENDSGGYSCRLLRDCITEFGAQGLELDAALVAWGTDLVMKNGQWNNKRSRGYRKNAHVQNPFQLRLNAYRVLLTRGRDGSIVFVPPLTDLDETFGYLASSGFKKI
jgi:DUF2075 family protein